MIRKMVILGENFIYVGYISYICQTNCLIGVIKMVDWEKKEEEINAIINEIDALIEEIDLLLNDDVLTLDNPQVAVEA